MQITSCSSGEQNWIRVNQVGYRNNDIKVAVLLSTEKTSLKSFRIVDAKTGEVAMTFDTIVKAESLQPFVSCYRLPFTSFRKSGTYRIMAGNTSSPDFRIDDNVYDDAADYLLNYMRQQRCGYNPYLKDSCHTHDGYEIYGKPATLHMSMQQAAGTMLLTIFSMLLLPPMPHIRCCLHIRKILHLSAIILSQTGCPDQIIFPIY